MNTLREKGWFLSEYGHDVVSDYGNITDIQQLIKRAINFDYKEIGNGEGNINEGNIVLQIQKIRNVSAPKNNEESRTAPRMLKLSLTDGKNNYQAVEFEHIPSLSLNTLPGSKLLLEKGILPISHGIILLRPNHIKKFLGGHVISLVEKWELNKKLALHSRVRSVEEGGPPPWIPFGQQIINIIDKTKHFKSLNDKAATIKEHSEFEAQRNDAIAEAAKKGSKKVFGGGNKQLLDHSVQKIIEQGFTIEQAEYALKMNRNNINRALKCLQKTDNKHNKETKEPKGRRFEKRNEETGKPSSGKVSLFDFLENKLPTQLEAMSMNDSSVTKDNTNHDSEKFQSQAIDHQSNKGGRSQKGSGWSHQNSKRSDDSNKWSNYNSTDCSLYYNAGNNNQHQQKPPRFQSQNNEGHNLYQQDNAQARNFNKPVQSNEHKNNYFVQSRFESGIQNQTNNKNQSGSTAAKHNTLTDSRSRNKSYDDVHGRRSNQMHDAYQKNCLSNASNKSHRNQQNKQNCSDDSHANKSTPLYNTHQQKENQFISRQENALATGTWNWQKGDKCLAKYWEDNMYYNAEVFAVSDRTCVVQFKEFNNYEEVLQIDCIPITVENLQYNSMPIHNPKHQDHRVSNRNTRYNHNLQTNVIDSRGSENVRGKNYRKRNQQRSTQPIYQPPAQRNVFNFDDPPSTN